MGRADEFNFARSANFSKVSVFRKEAIPWMNGLNISNFSSADNSGDVKVAFSRVGRADANGLVCKCQIGCIAISFAVNSDDFDPHIFTGTNNTESDFTTIGN